ncbi:MAG TPA: hypothetical protein VNW52_03820 [Burkholderiaceae bacterium]|jgi:DNA uptake protein ComE-like DNA-binding protein|nr:hypothetical protein [Burkholderiaceae bacterium]
MGLSVISPIVVPALDAASGVAAVAGIANNAVAPNIAELASPATVVELSATAQLLSTVEAPPTLATTANPTINTGPTIAPALDQSTAAADSQNAALAIAAVATANPATPIIDPAVAAAIAAYRVGNGLFSEKETLADVIQQETELEVVPTARLEGTTLDLHDGARDDVLNGSTWNWVPVQAVLRRFTRR